jgi:signal transduction histidine kinase
MRSVTAISNLSKKKSKDLLYRIPLRLILIIPFVAQTLAIVGVVAYSSIQSGREAVETLAVRLAKKTTNNVSQALNVYMAQPHRILQMNVHAIETGVLNPRDPNQMTRHFWKQAQIYKNISYIGYVLRDRQAAGVGRWLPGHNLVLNKSFNEDHKVYTVNDKGNPAQLIQANPYHLASEQWDAETIKAGKPIWRSTVHTPKGSDGYISLSLDYPIYDRKHTILGVIEIDLLLTDISRFLNQLNPDPNTKTFILGLDGKLIAHSISNKPYRIMNNQTLQLDAVEDSDGAIRNVAQQLQQTPGGLSSIESGQNLSIWYNGERHFAHVKPWRDADGLNWLVVAVLPESNFTQQTKDNLRNTFWLCLGALVGSIGFGVYTSRWISRPILRLSRASEAIAAGDLYQQVKSSKIKEIGKLATSFNRMADQLRDSFINLSDANNQLEVRVSERTTELSEALQELQRTQAQMLQAEKMSSLGQLVAGIAHEVNNPVNFIHGNINYVHEYTQQLLELVELYQQTYTEPVPAIADKIDDIDLDFLSTDLPKLLSSMRIGTDRIAEIVKSLRNFSRLDEADLKQADLHEGLDNTLLILQHRLKSTQHKTAISIMRDYGSLPSVYCYPGQLNQVFMNILANAIDALAERQTLQNSSSPPQITIRTQRIENWVEIAIADNGCGIPEDIQSRIFDPFFTTKPVGKGTGMGMSISYQIITQKHHGKLLFFSTPNQGTEFLIQIPIAPPAEPVVKLAN